MIVWKGLNRYNFQELALVSLEDAKLTQLLMVADLGSARDAEFRSDHEFEVNWHVVKQWTEQSRYERAGRQPAQDLLNAVADRRHGVLR